VAERQEVSRGWQAIRRSVRLKECARCHMLMGGLPELQIAFNGFTKAMIKGGTMKRLALLAVIWLGCGGSGGVYNEHYDRQCSVVFPTGGQCNTCGPTGTPIVTFACGSSCIPAESHCSVGPGCACNVFKVVQAP
jgi:hypothetical protein